MGEILSEAGSIEKRPSDQRRIASHARGPWFESRCVHQINRSVETLCLPAAGRLN